MPVKPALPKLKIPISERDHILGPADAPVTILEYGDYECPHCGAAVEIIREVRQRFGPSIRYVFRHFPLAKVHPQARLAAQAAEAAAAQGKFWEMHDLLFEHQLELGLEKILELAGGLNLDVDRIKSELESGVHASRVQEDMAGGIRSGANGTPTFFINEQRHAGYERSGLIAAVEELLKGTP